MQLDPSNSLEPQLTNLGGGTQLEDLVAANLAYFGYTVFPCFCVAVDGEDIGEIDVFASLQTPFHESRLIFECKGGEPTYSDIRQFAPLSKLLSPTPLKSYMVCRQGTRNSRKAVGQKLGIELIERPELVKRILPLIGGASVRPERILALNRWLAAFAVHRYLVGKSSSSDVAKAHLRFVSRELWWIEDPKEQCEASYEKAMTEHRDTTEKAAAAKSTTATSHIHNPNDDDIEAAMFVELLHRIVNMYAVTRYALDVQQNRDIEYLTSSVGPQLREAIIRITDNPRILFAFPNFFQYWIMVWGGILNKNVIDQEISYMAQQCSTTEDAIRLYLSVIEATYSSAGSVGLFYENGSIKFFKYVPAAFRALGVLNRRSCDLLSSSGSLMREDIANIDALDRALADTGGVAGLELGLHEPVVSDDTEEEIPF